MKRFSFENYTTEQLKKLRFFVPLNPMDIITPFGFGLKNGNKDKAIPVECKFIEKRYKLDDHYKCEVIPVDEKLQPLFGSESFYQCDFESMVNRDDYIVMKRNDKQHVKHVTWREYITPTVYLEHSGWTIEE